MVFAVLVFIFLLTSFGVNVASRSEESFIMIGVEIPITAFTGVLSSFGNISIIFMVMYYKKKGFLTSITLLGIQFPFLFWGFVFEHNLACLPGFFINIFTIITIILIFSRNKKIENYQQTEMDHLKRQQMFSQRLFEQTATALVNAVDAKDTYSHGHSLRVAEYSKKIAKEAGMDEEECRKIYYAALLHDIGKIGIPISIINKNGKLTDEEYEVIKQHPVLGKQILSSISEYPYLSIGAHYHHERYDGKGYPSHLKGEDIPEIARIISVADAYDAMSSNRSYREAIPQQLVREEIIKGAGNQFDPRFAKIMQHLIDMDPEYEMREKDLASELSGRKELYCKEHRSEISDGIAITQHLTKIRLKVKNTGADKEKHSGASMVLYDSWDSRIHDEEKTIRELNYFEYCEIWLDGRVIDSNIRKLKTEVRKHKTEKSGRPSVRNRISYTIDAVKYKDHVRVRIDDGLQSKEITIALPDSTRYVYIGLTGEYCNISNVSIEKEESIIGEDDIPRIAEEISYINGPQGDIPNVQIDGFRTEATVGIPLKETLKIDFHTMSLPTAWLVWHCPYLIIFSSADGKIHGEEYREYALIRYDGESWESEGISDNQMTVNLKDEFAGWDAWRKFNKEGYDSTARFERKGTVITTVTENHGIMIQDTMTVLDGAKELYVAITGDQVAITNIRIGV
ncbi:MAG: HD-GYP domain-containing protein [Lachnospiraceae bacterium]|nr:HD-GYP domain-containing protein [Lachnospiraceae bacterium]